MTFFVYILECRDNTYYTGYTNNIEKRLERHNNGTASKYTRSRLPVKIVWKKKAKSRNGAMKTEVKIKKMTRSEKKRLVEGARLDNILRKYA